MTTNKLFHVELFQYFTNLTIISSWFGVKHIDSAYWTLVVEIKFYCIVGLILFCKQINKIYWMFLGVMSYTLYLLNSIAGSLILQYYENVMNKYLVLIAVVVLMLFLSFSISKFIEKQFCLKTKQF